MGAGGWPGLVSGPMRGLTVGGVLLAIVAAGWGMFVPVNGSVLGTSYSCGVPIVRAFVEADDANPTTQAVEQQCRSESAVRLFVGGIGFVIGAGMAIIGLAVGKPVPPPAPPSVMVLPPRFDGHRWWWHDGHGWRPIE